MAGEASALVFQMLESTALNAIPAPARNLFLVLLSAAAGCVDAIAFIHVGVFPANMTGNSVVLATNLLHPASGAAILSALALLGFCAGAAASARMVRSAEHAWSHRTNIALLGAAALVLGAAAAIPFTGDRYMALIILATASAMGIQSAAVQQLGIAGVATVFMTGTLTTAVSRFVGGVQERMAGRLPLEKSPWLPALTWSAYFLGAFLGGLHRILHTPLPFALPGILILGVALASGWCLRRGPACKQGT